MASNARDRLIQSAVRLFYRNGYTATGIEKILAEAEVSKPTLYRHFRTKEDLIIAALRRWDEDCRLWLTREMDNRATDGRGQLLALFDTLEDWFDKPGFQGCMFINATAEYAELANPVHRAAAEHKRLFGENILARCRALGVSDPEQLAGDLLLLMEGAICTAHVSGRRDAARRARRIAENLIDDAAKSLGSHSPTE